MARRQDTSQSRSGQQFGILILRETDRSRPGLQQAMALIDGGCSKGLTVGMTGAVWDDSADDPVKLANVEVADVQAFESLCLLKSLRRRKVALGDRVTFDVAPLSSVELLSRGETYYESGMKEQAWACYEEISGLADSNVLVRTRLDEFRNTLDFVAPPMTSEDSSAMMRRVPGLLTVAGAYIRQDKPNRAKRIARKVLAIDSASEGARELLNALEAYDDCRIDLKSLFFGKGDTAEAEKLPRMRYASSPRMRIPPSEYYDFPKKTRPHDTAWVRALVSSRGNVMKAELHRSCGLILLDLAAVEAASVTKFEPGISCGRPMAMWVKWKIEFWREVS